MKLKVLIFSLLMFASNTLLALEYSIVPLGTLGGEISEAFDINNKGQIVGTSTVAPGNYHAFLSTETNTGRSIIDLGTPGEYASAKGINDKGQIVGEGKTTSVAGNLRYFDIHAFVFNDIDGNRNLIDLGAFGTMNGPLSTAIGIDNLGQVFGTSTLPNRSGTWRKRIAFSASDTGNGWVMNNLGALDNGIDVASEIFAVNDIGQAVGVSYGSGNYFLISNSVKGWVMTELPGPGYAKVKAINNKGQIVFNSFGFPATYLSSESDTGRVLTEIDALNGVNVLDINDSGEMVGFRWSTSAIPPQNVAIVYANNELLEIQDLIVDGLAGWSKIISAVAINNLGEITGNGIYNGQKMAFLLTPIDTREPPVCQLGSDPQTVRAGEAVPLWWWAQDAVGKPMINNGIGVVNDLEGYKWVFPSATTNYQMTVNGRGGESTCETTIVVEGIVEPVPVSCQMGAEPQTIQAGEEVPLWWWFQETVTAASIDNAVGPVNEAQGFKWVHPTESTTYTMTVSNDGGNSGTCETLIEVAGETTPSTPACVIGAYHQVVEPRNFNNSKLIDEIDQTTLWWWTPEETETAKISPVDRLVAIPQGTRKVIVRETTTFRMEVKSRGRSGFCETTVVVLED